MKCSTSRVIISCVLLVLLIVGLWYGHPRTVGSFCGGLDGVTAIDLSLDDGEALHLEAGTAQFDAIVEKLNTTYCVHQFNNQLPIDRDFTNIVSFAGGPKITMELTRQDGVPCSMIWDNEAILMVRGLRHLNYKPLLRATPRIELADMVSAF